MGTLPLNDKIALVTGATSGIGMETAKALAVKGATVILGCRNLEAARKLVDTVKASHPEAKLVVPGTALDLVSQDSVKAFAREVDASFPALHILVNNAGVSFMKKAFTTDGVGAIAQTNYLGPYTLTRLLEKKLVASGARVVNVASVTHRSVEIKDAKAFLTDWRSGYYQHTKLANVYFAYELQRRLGARGVTSCAADPGGVRSNIWNSTPALGKGFARYLIDMCYSPPEDGAKSVIAAATEPWESSRAVVRGTPVAPGRDLRYYSRGLFNHPVITLLDGLHGKSASVLQRLMGLVWGLHTLTCSLLDWPLRKLTGGRFFSSTRTVRSSTSSYKEDIAKELWDVSAEFAKLPAAPQL